MFNQQQPYGQGYSPAAGYSYPGAVDQPVPQFMAGVFGWMTVGLAVTGVVAFLTANSPTLLNLIYGNPVVPIVLLIASFVMVFVISGVVARLSPAVATFLFLVYGALNGLWLSGIFLAYTVYSPGALARAFWVSAGMFAIMALIGFTTRIDLTRFGPILFMGLIGIIIASVVNFFLHSPAVYWIVTYVGVVIFLGLTAYDTQRIKRLAASGAKSGSLAIRGALMLYLDFLNLFLFMLRIFGGGRN